MSQMFSKYTKLSMIQRSPTVTFYLSGGFNHTLGDYIWVQTEYDAAWISDDKKHAEVFHCMVPVWMREGVGDNRFWFDNMSMNLILTNLDCVSYFCACPRDNCKAISEFSLFEVWGWGWGLFLEQEHLTYIGLKTLHWWFYLCTTMSSW